jgi:acetyl-CoA carboxylase biotin carboxylase subunit
MVTGVDVVREQLRIAGGAPLSVSQEEVKVRGHAIEARVNSESPAHGFMPVPGTLERWAVPVTSHVRVDTACFPGWTVTPYYDSILAKVISWGDDRSQAIGRLRHALGHLRVEGVETTAGFVHDVLEHSDFVEGRVHTRWIEDVFLPSWASREAVVA